MSEHMPFAPDEIVDRTPRLRPLVITCLVLVAAIVGLLLWPTERLTPIAGDILPPVEEAAPSLSARVVDVAEAVAFEAAALVEADAAVVTRAETAVFGVPPLPEDRSVSRVLRKPVRLMDRGLAHQSAHSVAEGALVSLNAGDPRLLRVLSHALETGKSNAYIDALLNGALVRGEITLPQGLVLPDGAVDTAQILQAVLQGAGY